MDDEGMTAFSRLLTLGLLMAGFAAPSLAQETTEETPEIGETYLKSTHGDWRIRCQRRPIGERELCDMFHVVEDNDQPVIEMAVLRADEGDGVIAGGIIHTPLEVLLTQGIQVLIDGKPAGRVPYVLCTPQFCRSEFPLKESDVDAFRRGGNATLGVVVLTEPPRELTYEVSLTGFTAAFGELPE